MITIEKGIPMPLARGRERSPLTSDLARMEVGDSFKIENDVDRIRNKVAQYGLRRRKRFSVLKTPDGAHRCWRVE